MAASSGTPNKKFGYESQIRTASGIPISVSKEQGTGGALRTAQRVQSSLEKDTRIIIALTPVSPSRPKPIVMNKPQFSNFNTSRPVAHSSLNLYGSNHNIGGGILLSPVNTTTT